MWMYLCWKLKNCKIDVNSIEIFLYKKECLHHIFHWTSFLHNKLLKPLNCILYKQVEYSFFVGFTGMEKIYVAPTLW